MDPDSGDRVLGGEAGVTTPTASTQLLVLGPPMIIRGATPRPPGTQKALALAGYLGIRGEPVPRERLAALLWPGSASDQARRSLRGELARLRSAFADDAVGG
ncbi:MAG: hypothetical protein GEU74_15220, partial [Nitriliruptorales bacterium]|nr:hypothetical protein [Nitriliruptorales bacterium]